jgi:Carboxypeptidase regulatory-like domain
MREPLAYRYQNNCYSGRRDMSCFALPAFLILCLLCFFCVSAFGQAPSGITGTVTDPSGSVVVGAQVIVKSLATNLETRTTTTSAGTYTTTGLLPGLYTVTVTAPGFEKSIKDQVNVEVSVQATIDLVLKAGNADQTVEVTANLITLNTTQPELGTTIENEVVQALPTEVSNGRGRQIDSFIFLAPGTQGTAFSHRINGGVDFQTETVFNGIPVVQPETQGYQTFFNPPYEMVNESRVERTTFSPQYGLAQGATLYQMASGTNALHGDAFEVNRNNFFDAKGYFNDVTPIDKENNYGFTLGGPVVIPHLYNGHNRTFFHFSLDFTKQDVSNNTIGTVPTAQEKKGDFSDFVDSTGRMIPIFDPTTGAQFPNNYINPNRFSAVSSSLLSSVPDPDLPGLLGNKRPSANSLPNINHIWGFSIDHNLTQSQSIHYSMWRDSESSYGFDYAPIVSSTNVLQSQKYNPTLGTVFLLNYTYAITPKLVMTAGADWVGELNDQTNVKRGVSFAGVQASPISDTFPNIQFDGSNQPTNWGTAQGWVQSINRKLGISIVNNWMWLKGRNTFNIGGSYRRAYQDDNECQACGGQLNFSQRSTADPANISTTGSAFASFLLGQVDSTDRIFANELKLRNLAVSPYIQDDIKLTQKLTVNAGIRWDIMLPFTENNNQIVYLDPTQQNAAAGNLFGAAAKFGNGNITRADIHYKNFGPRLGLAYAINDKTVVQAGYSIAFLNGGAFEYGTSKVAVSYGNLLQGQFSRNSTNSTTPGYGDWDANPIPAPPAVAFNPALGIGTTIRAFDPTVDGRAPYTQQWSFNVQRSLPWNVFLTVAYVGNRSVHLNGQLNPLNQPNPSILGLGSVLQDPVNSPAAVAAGVKAPYANFINDFGSGATVAQALAPFPQYAQVYNNYDLSGAANYNGLQTSVEKRFSNGLGFLTSYTLSKSMSNVDSGFTTFASLPENKYNQKAEWTVGQNDIRNNVKLSGTYELPLGKGKKFANSNLVAREVLGGFQVGFITGYQSGTPIGISENDNPLGTSGQSNRPNQVSGAPLKTFGYHFNGRTAPTTPSFSTNAFVSTSHTYTLGNSVRYYPELRQPALYNEDLNVRKKFALGERATFILQMDYFNVLNRTQFNGPGTNIDNSNYGLLTPGQQNTPRQGQVSGRVVF